MNRRKLLMAGGVYTMSMAIPALASAATTGTITSMSEDSATLNPIPPVARIERQVINQLGRTRIDNYGWMRDENWQEVLNDPSKLSANIRTHLEAENAYTRAILLGPTAELRETLVAEMRGRIKEDDETPPAPDGNFAYFRKFREGGQYPIIVRVPIDPLTKAANGPETIMLDGDAAARGLPFWRLINWEQNESQDFFAYMVDFEGARNCDIRFRIASNGQDLPEKLENTTGELVWAKDNRTCFYVVNDENVRPVKVMRHVVGTDPKTDALVFQETDPAYFLGLSKSASGDFVFLVSSASDNNECRYLPLDRPQSVPRLFSRRRAGFEYFPDHHGDHFYFKTNKDGAKDYKVMRTKTSEPALTKWKDYIEYKAGNLVNEFILFKNHMARQEMFDALPRIVIRNMANGEEHSIGFTEEAYSLELVGGFEFDTNTVRFIYSSPSTPAETYDYDMETRERKLLKRQQIPSGHNPADYVVKRIEAPTADGAQVPLTILYKKGTPLDGSAPCHLYGYGSYGIIIDDDFNANILSLVNRGYIHAVAHMRGGMERGYQWYLDGKLRKKQNTFSDYIRCAEVLIERNYTSKGNIVGNGRSAGGLLMGVVANQRPDLFAGIIAGVAFVDMMTTISDATLPLTPPEWTEWGNPITSVEDYDAMAAYSPYDNVETRAYPPIFAQTALSDSQVTYWEPAKWIAKLRATSPNAGPFLLRVNMEAGHGGAPGRFDRLKEVAEYLAFAIWANGRKQASPPLPPRRP